MESRPLSAQITGLENGTQPERLHAEKGVFTGC